MSAVHTARARAAVLTRHHGADSPKTLNAHRDLAAEKIAAYIERTVAAAPPLSDEQRTRLAGLLAPASAGGAAA